LSAWQYASSGGTRYPVQPQDVWRADQHIIACGDLEEGDGLRLIERFGPPDLTYCDPPWNNGNASAFRTKAGMPGKVDFTGFLEALLKVTCQTRRDVFLEMGNLNAPHLITLAEYEGAQLVRRWPITYYGRHPCTLIQLRWHGEGADPPDLTGMDDEDTPAAAVKACARPGDVIMDPCTGRGLTAATVARADIAFIGLELSPWRLSCTLTRLALLGCKINREGSL
jgi:hypothetical protein